MEKRKIKILIADDQALMRDALQTILDLEEDMEVICTASNGQEAYEMASHFLPDVVLLDVRMPVIDGVETVRLLKRDFPQIKVIMLTTFDDEEYIINALAYGADGFLLKDLQGDQLIEAVRNGVKEQLILPAKVARKLAIKVSKILAIEKVKNNIMHIETDELQLSNREKEVAVLLVKGLSNRQIANYLNLSEGTIKNYISAIYDKVGTNDRKIAISHLKNYYHIYL